MLKSQLLGLVKHIKGNSSRISVRQKMQYLDKYTDEDTWQCISPVMAKEIKSISARW